MKKIIACALLFASLVGWLASANIPAAADEWRKMDVSDYRFYSTDNGIYAELHSWVDGRKHTYKLVDVTAEFDAKEKAEEDARQQVVAKKLAIQDEWRRQNPCRYKVGDRVGIVRLYGYTSFRVTKVNPHPAGGWLMNVESEEGRELQFRPEDCDGAR